MAALTCTRWPRQGTRRGSPPRSPGTRRRTEKAAATTTGRKRPRLLRPSLTPTPATRAGSRPWASPWDTTSSTSSRCCWPRGRASRSTLVATRGRARRCTLRGEGLKEWGEFFFSSFFFSAGLSPKQTPFNISRSISCIIHFFEHARKRRQIKNNNKTKTTKQQRLREARDRRFLAAARRRPAGPELCGADARRRRDGQPRDEGREGASEGPGREGEQGGGVCAVECVEEERKGEERRKERERRKHVKSLFSLYSFHGLRFVSFVINLQVFFFSSLLPYSNDSIRSSTSSTYQRKRKK